MMPGKSLREIRDSVTEDGMLNDLQFAVFQSLELSAPYYQGILDKITGKPRSGIGKWRSSRISTPNRTCYEFSYDWRRSCDENAVRLAALVEKETRLIEAKRRAAGSSRPVRFDIVAHSQGALLARYYLRYGGQSLPENGELPDLNWAGADHIDNVVLMGAPNAGVTKTLKFLTHGHKHHTVLPYYEPAVIGTMPSIYQMLPRAGDQVLIAPKTGAVLDPLDFDLWLEKEWGLANPKQDKELAKLLPHVKDPGERRLIALDHLRKCLDSARQFQAALDVPSYRPNHLHMVMCACDSKQTPVRFLAQRYEVRVHQRTKGDGMVSFRSASRCLSPCLRNGIQGPSWDAFRVFKTNHDKMAMKSKVSEFVLMALSPR
jgi:pimeloyl-ACP methyl ester carboxylesterase